MHELQKLLPKDSWFREWLEIFPLCEAPRSYLLVAAFSALGAAIGRGVYFAHDVHTLFPMLNILLIGPSGIGKTTSLELGSGLIRSSPELLEHTPVILGKATPEKLHEDLVAAPKSIIFAEELAAFFNKQKYMEGMVPYVTALLNYPDVVELRTRHEGVTRVENPAVTIMGGSTPEWLQDQLPDSATTGGFLARFFIVFEEYKFRRIALPGLAMGREAKRALEDKRDQVIREFGTLVTAASGEMVFSDWTAIDEYTKWYNEYRPESGFLSPFAARAGEFILRLACLCAISRKHSRIDRYDIRFSIRFYELCARKLGRVVIPFSPDGKLLDQVLHSIGQREMSQVEIRRAMRNVASAHRVDLLVDSLLASEDLVRLKNGQLRRLNV